MAGQDGLVSGDGWVSDDSSFYGDTDEKNELEKRNQNFNTTKYWAQYRQLPPQPTTMASPMSICSDTQEPVKLHNPLEGQEAARQLSETVAEFTKRLPPITTRLEDVGHWIWIANPYPNGREVAGNADLLVEGGMQLLEQYKTKREEIERTNLGKAKGTITRKLGLERELLKEQIVRLANACKLTSGKWMLFPEQDELSRVWRLVAEGVAENRLGTAAKVATAGSNPNEAQRLICVYTKDFSDVDDVRRVLLELVNMGLLQRDASRGIYYKCDAYTYLNLNSGNEYGIQASFYSSKDMLNTAKRKEHPVAAGSQRKKQTTLDSFR